MRKELTGLLWSPLRIFNALCIFSLASQWVGQQQLELLLPNLFVVLAAMQDFLKLLTNRPPEVIFAGFADRAIPFTLRFWIPCRQQVGYVGAKSEAIMRLKRAFDQARIVIAFPSRTREVSPALLQQMRQKLSHFPE